MFSFRPNRSIMILAVGTLVLGASVSTCRAHSEPVVPPKPGPPPVASPLPFDTVWVYPLRWSWLHWWEANRDPYLRLDRQRVTQEDQPEAIARQRAKAVAALTTALNAGDWRLRAAAAFSLGQMGETPALPLMAGLAKSDRSAEVQQVASLGMGLLGAEEAETALTAKGRWTEVQQLSRYRALGLLSSLRATTIRLIHQERAAVAIRVAGVWATAQVDGAANGQALTQLLMRTDNPWLASEAMLALGRAGNKQAVPILADVLLATGRGQSIPAWRRVEAIRLEKLEMAGVLKNLRVTGGANTVLAQFYADYLKRYREWQRESLNPYPPDDYDRAKMIFTLRLGIEEIYLGQMRAAAAIALGHINSPESRRALMLAIQQTGDEFGGHWNDVNALARAHEFSDLHKGMAIMSLGRIADPASLDLLIATLGGNIVTKIGKTPNELVDSPLRGYAALALGMYARPVDTPQGPQDRPGFDKVCELLASCAANPNETAEVRCACTLGLGLTGRTANLRFFGSITETAGRLNDVTHAGFDLMARAMLGDRKIIEPARQLLARPEVPDSVADVVGRRAVILALGLHGAQEIIPVLNAAWHQSYHVNREVSVAMCLCRGYSATDALVDLVENGPTPLAQVFGARCLADLFMKEESSRIARLLNTSNYAMANRTNLFLQGVANEFLFHWLIPAFGETWY
jgi:HEAT repeat protein